MVGASCLFCNIKHKAVPIARSTLSHQKNKEINNAVDRMMNASNGLVLVVHGPPGCGKRTSMDLMIAERQISCRRVFNEEWTIRELALLLNSSLDNRSYVTVFENVIPQSTCPLQRAFRDRLTDRFLAQVREARIKAIFMCTTSDVYSERTALREWFSEQFLVSSNVEFIRVPPVTTASIKRCLEHITNLCHFSSEIGIRDTISGIAEDAGDIRAATVQLQWVLLKYRSSRKTTKAEPSHQQTGILLPKKGVDVIDIDKEPVKQTSVIPNPQNRDAYLNIGHATARFLYGRPYTVQEILYSLPEVSGMRLLSFFHHNMLQFFDAENIEGAAAVYLDIACADEIIPTSSSNFFVREILPLECVICAYRTFNANPNVAKKWQPCTAPPFMPKCSVSYTKWRQDEDDCLLHSILFCDELLLPDALPPTKESKKSDSLPTILETKNIHSGSRNWRSKLAVDGNRILPLSKKIARTSAPSIEAKYERKKRSLPKHFVASLWSSYNAADPEGWKKHLREEYYDVVSADNHSVSGDTCVSNNDDEIEDSDDLQE